MKKEFVIILAGILLSSSAVLAQADLIVKTVSHTGTLTAGNSIRFTAVVSNQGNKATGADSGGTEFDEKNNCKYYYFSVSAGSTTTTSTTTTIVTSSDATPPTSVITAPASGSTQNGNFNVQITDSDAGGSGLRKCYYAVTD